MAYSTPEMVRLALLPSSDGSLPTAPSNTAADLSDQQLVDAIAEADAHIDSMIGGRYATPVELISGDVPHPLDYWSRNIAAYNAALTYRQNQPLPDDHPVALRWRATMDALDAVSRGRASLPLPSNVGPSAAAGAGPAYNPYGGDLWVPADFEIGNPRQSRPGLGW